MTKQQIVVTVDVETDEMPDQAAFTEALNYSITMALFDLYGVHDVNVTAIQVTEQEAPAEPAPEPTPEPEPTP
jgi:hypothetical protein